VVPAALLYVTGTFHFFLDQQRLTDFLNSLGVFSYVGFIVLQVFQVVAAPIPGEATGFIGGFLYGVPLGILLSTVGLTIGSWLAFALSKIFGRPLVEKMVSKETIDRYNYLLHSKGLILIFLLFFFPGFPKDYLSYVLGLGQLSTRVFLIISTLGRLAGTTMLTLGGSYIRNHQFGYFFTLTSIVTVIIILTIMYRDKIEQRLKKWHLKRE
jgi:uncharacterized membrane protein YdjX (TVP38/TMEM64 family)